MHMHKRKKLSTSVQNYNLTYAQSFGTNAMDITKYVKKLFGIWGLELQGPDNWIRNLEQTTKMSFKMQ